MSVRIGKDGAGIFARRCPTEDRLASLLRAIKYLAEGQGQMENTKATEDLFTHFRRIACGDVQAASALVLAHTLRQQPATGRKPAQRDRLTPPEVAKLLGVSPDSVRGWIASGALKAVNVAGPGKRPSHRISREALAEFERRRTPEPVVVRRRRKPATEPLVKRY